MDWDVYFESIVRAVAEKSQDRSSKYGAVIVRPSTHSVLATGYNGIPRGVEYREEYHQRPDKYMWFVHAEQNAIFNAAREGTRLEGTSMYVIHPPCVECMRAIVQVGIGEVVYIEPLPAINPNELDQSNWRLNMDAAYEISGSSGVRIRQVGRRR